jgi:hypothetical protein
MRNLLGRGRRKLLKRKYHSLRTSVILRGEITRFSYFPPLAESLSV